MTDGFKAYPKWITTPEGARKIVQDADEEAVEMAVSEREAPAEEKEAPKDNELPAHPATRADLIAQAEAKGIKTDGRWSDARLIYEIQKATA